MSYSRRSQKRAAAKSGASAEPSSPDWWTKHRWEPGECTHYGSAEVFIAFKNSDATGQETRDSLIAKTLATFLRRKGLSVFLSLDSLERLGKSAYMEAIETALNDARVLIAVGTSPENVTSGWVKYEWHSFHQEIIEGRKPDGEIFLVVEGIGPSNLPLPLRQRQLFPFSEDGFERLARFVQPAIGGSPSVRLPFYLLIDASRSMDGERLQSLEIGLTDFLGDLLADSLVRERVWVSVITFGRGAWQISPLTPATSFKWPTLWADAQEKTALGAALDTLNDALAREVVRKTAHDPPSYCPLAWVIIDGNPTDDWLSAARRLMDRRNPRLARMLIVAAGQDADVSAMRTVAPKNVLVSHITELNAQIRNEFFMWLVEDEMSA